MQPIPMNWPIGDGQQFRGVYDRDTRGVYLYERTERNEKMAPEVFVKINDIPTTGHISERERKRLEEDVQLLDELGISFDHEHTLTTKQTPVFFGSALTNFGVRLFLNAFVEFAPPPQPYISGDEIVKASKPDFSGFVFKIQANMNPKHRDSVAFLRVCSGKFERGITTTHAQSGATIRLTRPYKLFANEREIVDEAFPGDVVGIPNTGNLSIGDTLYVGEPVRFADLPRFEPEHFALLKNNDISKQKQFNKGLQQLEKEGAVQVFYNINAFKREPILAVVGQLQFDVVQARLEMEYNVSAAVEPLNFAAARYVDTTDEIFNALPKRSEVILARDSQDRKIALFSSPFIVKYYAEKNPELKFIEMG
jgi:peptide chain release factor 3